MNFSFIAFSNLEGVYLQLSADRHCEKISYIAIYLVKILIEKQKLFLLKNFFIHLNKNLEVILTNNTTCIINYQSTT